MRNWNPLGHSSGTLSGTVRAPVARSVLASEFSQCGFCIGSWGQEEEEDVVLGARH
jgi:hypothetical protein